jgi:NAD(P)-dependent dehydrogenase (short-subunit alcohol dehydrogenase family)
VTWCEPLADAEPEAQEHASDEAVAAGLARIGAIDLLVVDAAATLPSAASQADGSGNGEAAQLAACLLGAWTVTRSVFNLAFLPAGRGGRIVYLAPASAAGEQAEAARAGLENLSRTLSIEWARHGVTAVTIAPGATTTPGEVAALVAYLASPAGAYFSGCLLDLGSIRKLGI